jgi:N-acyl-L-homoserine lactone synthetase
MVDRDHVLYSGGEGDRRGDLIADMHRLRRCVFKDRLDWDVSVSGDMEIDPFDALRPTYLIAVKADAVVGCARLLPTTGPAHNAHAYFPSSAWVGPTTLQCLDFRKLALQRGW